jgi:hypothetical protein
MEYALNCADEESNYLPVGPFAEKIIAFVKKKEEELRTNRCQRILAWSLCKEFSRPYGGAEWSTTDWVVDILRWKLKGFTIRRTYYPGEIYQLIFININQS